MRIATLLIFAAFLVSPAAEAKTKGPSGTFRGESGTVKLAYLGEGMVSVKLKTKYCALDSEQGATFIFPHVHVTNKRGEPLLVIFYQRKKIVVYAEQPAFARDHCKSGKDATGVYKRR